MRLTLPAKLLAIAATATVAFVLIIASGSEGDREIADRMTRIRREYIPRIRLRPVLERDLETMSRAFQDAVAAQDPAAVDETAALERDFLRQLDGARDAIDPALAARLRTAIRDYRARAAAVSRRMIAGEGGEDLVEAMEAMQRQRRETATLIERTTAFRAEELSRAFAAVARAQADAAQVRTYTAVGSLVLLLLLSFWIARDLRRSLGHVTAGLERFGRGELGEPIPVVSRDELGDVARRANEMAASLDKLAREREREERLRAVRVALAQELGGELEPADAAARALRVLARSLGAPAAALFFDDGDRVFRVLARTAGEKDGAAGAGDAFRLGEGLVGEAAARAEIVVVADPPPGYLRVSSGLGAAEPRTLVLVPLRHGDRVRGVVELALFEPWTGETVELLRATQETVTIAIEVAKARVATRELLAATRAQAVQLADEVTQRKRVQAELEVQNERVHAANRLKSEFLANMSHELRTPLNAIIGFAQLLVDREVPADSPEHHEFVTDILASGKHLLQLVNDILDLSKIEAGKMDLRPERVEVARLIGEVTAIMRTTVATKRIALVVKEPEVASLVIDPARLKQVLYNYLSNAIKFTPEGGTVTVSVTREDDACFRLAVADTGVGIAAADIPRLFVDFEQLDQTANKQHGGTGLGLALTRRLVEAQGGRVGVVSTPGKGSTFHAVLPIEAKVATPAARAPEAPRPEPRAPEGAPAVLVIEDDSRDRGAIAGVLRDAGYEVVTATDGAEALRLGTARRFDAITLDLLLPDASGLDVLRAIRAEGPNVRTPVWVVSVVAEKSAVAGIAVTGIVPKPIDVATLLAALENAGVRPDPNPCVLVVDDDESALRLMAAALERLGYRAVCRTNPVAALDEVRTLAPVAVIVDLIMPELDGIAFLERLRAMPEAAHLPAFMWTVKDLGHDERTRLAMTTQGIIHKAGAGDAGLVTELRRLLPASPARPRAAPAPLS